MYLVITLLGIYVNKDIFDQDENVRIFTTVLFICIKKLKTYVSYLELHNIYFIHRMDYCAAIEKYRIFTWKTVRYNFKFKKSIYKTIFVMTHLYKYTCTQICIQALIFFNDNLRVSGIQIFGPKTVRKRTDHVCSKAGAAKSPSGQKLNPGLLLIFQKFS